MKAKYPLGAGLEHMVFDVSRHNWLQLSQNCVLKKQRFALEQAWDFRRA